MTRTSDLISSPHGQPAAGEDGCLLQLVDLGLREPGGGGGGAPLHTQARVPPGDLKLEQFCLQLGLPVSDLQPELYYSNFSAQNSLRSEKGIVWNCLSDSSETAGTAWKLVVSSPSLCRLLLQLEVSSAHRSCSACIYFTEFGTMVNFSPAPIIHYYIQIQDCDNLVERKIHFKQKKKSYL